MASRMPAENGDEYDRVLIMPKHYRSEFLLTSGFAVLRAVDFPALRCSTVPRPLVRVENNI